MIITHHQKQFFKLQLGDTVIAVNPISKESKSVDKPARFGSTISLSTVRHADYNGVESVTYNNQEPFIIDSPGSYEVDDIFIRGLESKTEIDDKSYINTIYTFEFDGITILYLGHLISRELDSNVREAIENVDVVFVPVSSTTLSATDAYKLATSFEPKAIIPTEYDEKKDAEALQKFLKEGGDDSVKSVDKLTIKQKNIAEMSGDIVVISS
jgi:hypothetical protein